MTRRLTEYAHSQRNHLNLPPWIGSWDIRLHIANMPWFENTRFYELRSATLDGRTSRPSSAKQFSHHQ